MKQNLLKRSMGLLLALVLTLAAVPVSAMAAQSDFTLIELKGTDVILDETVFTYTGEEIRPNVTVRVEDRLLTLGKDYTLEYANNIEVGTGKVVVKGVATAAPSYGYTGTVEIPFEIKAKSDTPQAPGFTLVELKGTDVTIEGTQFTYTGSPIEPKVTVTVEGKVLTAGKDYMVSYSGNVEVGTGKATVTGIATASETFGYTGTVEMAFTIVEKEPEFILVEIKGTDVTIEGTEFTYTGKPIEPKVTVIVDGKELVPDQDYSVAYSNNIDVGTGKVTVSGIATASEAVGYTGTVEIDFTIKAAAPILTEIKGTDVTIEGTKFPYTGSYIEPKITVTVGGKVLTAGKDYTLTYHSNIGVGTATAVVTGIESAGYTGTVNVNFTIEKDAETPDFQTVTLTRENVTIGGTRFFYTGKAIEPKITVTVDGKKLKLGQDYSLTYENNIEIGTATAVVKGIATASETLGYTGEVKVNFTIVADTSDPEPVEYKITKGDKSTWYQESSKTLSFTSNGDYEDFVGVKINGKELKESYYTVKKGTVVTLKNSYLKKLDEGKYTITIEFEDGEATGAFRVKEGLDASNPETGDPIGIWFGLLGLSTTAAAALFLCRKKFFA